MTSPIPAATLVLMREAAVALEVLMVERAGAMAFAGGAMVFPGGRVDPGDRVLAAEIGGGLDADEAAARIAAIRETIEEVGIPVGVTPPPERIADARARLAAGEAIGAVIEASGWRLDLSALFPFARWLPNLPAARVFDTRFYAAPAPAGAEAIADGRECVRAVWTTAAAALAQADRGATHIIFPTRRNLERIAAFDSFAAFAADAAARAPEIITPWIERRGDEEWLCIPDDLGYPVAAEPLATARRG